MGVENREKTMLDVKRLIDYIHSLSDFSIASKMDGNYNHMGATISDAILQAGITYSTVVKPRVNRIKAQYPKANTTSGFLALLLDAGANNVLDFNGEKPQRILSLTLFLAEELVETESDLAKWISEDGNADKLKTIRGIGDKTVDYLKILVGISTNAVDRHLVQFVQAAGINLQGYKEIHTIINNAADELAVDRALFDHSIWRYMSKISSASSTNRSFPNCIKKKNT